MNKEHTCYYYSFLQRLDSTAEVKHGEERHEEQKADVHGFRLCAL